MLLAVDSYYFSDKAHSVAIIFEDWAAGSFSEVYTELREDIEEYVPGAFYKRELPCILSLLKKVELRRIDAIIIDAYVYLDDSGKAGLGARLYESLESKIPVIGVAKTSFNTVNQLHIPILRGESHNPLFVSAIGTDLKEAAENVKRMTGEHRIPKLLKELDTMTRSGLL